MRRPPLWIASTAAAAVLAAVPSLYAQATRLGTEFEVNAYTPGTQRGSAVAGDAGGGFVVAWQSYTQDGSGYGIFVRRFASTGAALATEFQANAYTIGGQYTPAVATESDGDFLVAWSSYYAQDGSGFGIFARRFTSTGAAIATEFQVNTYTPDQQSHPTAAFDADGDFVVTWQSYAQDRSGTGVFARRFASSGVALAVEFQVNAYTTNGQSYPSVAALTGGDFLIAWTSQAQDGAGYGVFARRFASSGVALGAEFQVNAHTQLGQYLPRVAGNGNGDFLVAWESQGQDGSYLGVFARPFSSAGTALAIEFQVNRYTINGQAHATLSADADGDFVVAWDSANQDGSGYGVFARRVTTAGGFIGGEFQVNTYTPNYQAEPAIAAPPTGDFIVTWTSFSQDRSFGGVFAQRFATAPVPTPTSTSTPTSTPTPGPGAPAAVGVEFQLNTYTIGSQRFPSAASDDDGDFVVAWQSDVQDGSSDGVFGRRFSSAGAALAVEFQVNAHTFYGQSRPATAADADGDFVIVWQSLGQDASSYGIFARRFSSSGAPQGFEFQVNHYSFGSQFGPSVAMEGDGDFVVVWGSYVQDGSNAGVFGRRFASSGAALAAEFQVNAYTTSSQAYPSVAVADDGEFVIVWQSQSQDGSYSGVFGRRFSSTGAALAAEFQINAYTVNYQFAPSVANDADGDFVVAWASYLQDGSGYGVFGRRFSSAGVPLAVEFRVNEHTPSSQLAPSVTADDDGDFVIAWQDLFHDGSVYGVFARRFTSAGVAFATEFQVNSYTTGYQIDPSAAAQANGDFVIAWSSVVQDGSNGGVFARRFTVGSESTPTPTPTATATPTATSTPPPATATDTPTATPSVTASATPTSTPTSTPTPSATASPTPTATASPTPTATASATPPPDPDHFACYQSNTTNKVCFDASGQPCNNDADCGGVKHACSNAFTSFAPIPGVRLSDQFADEATFVIGSPDRLCAPASKTWLDGTILHVDQADDLDGTHLVRYPVTATLPPVSTLFPPPGCATCAGGATYLNFRYTGATAASVRVLDSTNAVLFDQVVNPGGAFAVSGTAVNGTFLGPLRIFVGTLLHATLVTDCSRPLGPGLGVGAAFVVVDALSAATGAQPLCPVIRLTNQFETLYLERGAPREVLVPSAKALPSAGFPPGAPPDDVDHFECYDVKATAGRTGIVVHVADQFWNDEAADPSKFGPARDLRVLVPARLCNPVTKEGPVPGAQQRVPPAAQAHLLCYNVQPVSPDNSALKGLFSSNQLGQLRLDLGRVKELCVPSLKLAPAPLP